MYKVYGGLWNVFVSGEVFMCYVNMPAPKIMCNWPLLVAQTTRIFAQ